MTRAQNEKQRRKNEEELNFYSSSVSVETLEIVRRRLAKRANQRMVRLERSKSPISGEAYHIGAYDVAQDYLRTRNRKDAENLRFSEKLSQRQQGETDKEYRYKILEDIANMQTFLTSKSSTVKGNKSIEAARVASFEKMGISRETASSKSFYNFMTSKAYKYLNEQAIDSDRLQEIFDYYVDNDKRGMTAKDFQQVADEYHDWLTSPENADKQVKYKDLVDRLDAFMIKKGYDVPESIMTDDARLKRMIEDGLIDKEDLDKYNI